MSRISFENYSHIATLAEANNTEVAGRLAFQEEAQRRILFDLLAKLDIKVSDSLLEIGCGPGNLLVPLSGFCAKLTGIDNQAALTRLKSRFVTDAGIVCMPGNFLDMNLPTIHFDKVLVYSVLQYLTDPDEVFLFVERALTLLKPGGLMLLGDIPNISKKNRFLNSSLGQLTLKIWYEHSTTADAGIFSVNPDRELVVFDDALVFNLMAFIRDKAFEAYLLPQPVDLPFGGSREDILIVA
jgi:2-polyprenyl-3-methyl-5-hydroxy-6-metoxy-1,4-benzoquinol methylase